MQNTIAPMALAIAALAVLGTGCATIVSGKTQTVTIDSNVKDAEIVVEGTVLGTTPYNGPIKRGKDTTILLRKAGYEKKTFTLNTEVEPVFWGNIICGGFFGSTTDYATGSMYKYAPATINVDLTPEIEKK
jgi:PEGA domain